MSDHVANTISTGGGGSEFEKYVGAYFLALLLTKSFCPIFSNASPAKVHFQARRLGWHIDDVVVEATTESAEVHRICAQVKRTFTVSASDDDCVATFCAAWTDFNNAALFDKAKDALVLVTFLGTNRIQYDLRWLLGQARARTTAADFAECLSSSGTLNKRSKSDYDTIKSIIEKCEEAEVAGDRVWQFLRAFHVLSFDFLDSASKDEAFIKSILGALRAQDAPLDAGENSWVELVKLAGLSAMEGRSVELAGIPEELSRRHRQVASSKHGELSRLRQHSSVTLRRVSDSGPHGFSFDRKDLGEKISDAFSSNQIVLIVGSAGAGKSVLAKRFLAAIVQSETTFAFAAEEFKGAHIDQVLTRSNIALGWQEFLGLLPLHRKTFLVESLERLLETNDRTAFNDLLLAVRDDPSISLVLTCRDYYAEIVERHLLVPSGMSFGRVIVGGLSDDELETAVTHIPHLAGLISNAPLRSLLRNPFILAQASELDWTPAQSLPVTERALRKRLWSAIVRRDAFIADAMPAKRERAFLRVCVERARALRPFISVDDGEGVFGALADSNLVAFNDDRSRVAAAHDVFEDWGLAEWLGRQFSDHEGTAQGMQAAVGEHPALRRAYRKWLIEQLDEAPAEMVAYVAEASSGGSIPQHFRDDTLLAIFQSSAAEIFLAGFKHRLFASECELMKRVIDLVRVGCKTVDPAYKNLSMGSQWHVPNGRAWPILLQFLREHLTSIPTSLDAQIIGFIEDWSHLVSNATPYPKPSDSAGVLIAALLGRADSGWSGRETRGRLIELLLKIPKANSAVFCDLMRAATMLDDGSRDGDASLLAEAIFEPFKSSSSARDFPKEVCALATGKWMLAPSDGGVEIFSTPDVEALFGLKGRYENRFFPASAFQGPFFALLRSNPLTAVAFIVDLVNAACRWYLNMAAAGGPIEEPCEVDLFLADGTSKKIIANGRLWRAFRGTSVVPDLIQSSLMALEKWFLEAIEAGSDAKLIQQYIGFIFRATNNAATLGAVASVIMAHPNVAGDFGVSILGCREFFRLDIERQVADGSPMAPGGFDSRTKAFQTERVESNARVHRKKHLEDLAISLQMGEQSEAVQNLLDRYLLALPPESHRSPEETQWRLALQRMDLRTYTVNQAADGIELRMGALPSDVSKMLDRIQPEQEKFVRVARVQTRAQAALAEVGGGESDGWREYLALAKMVEAESIDGDELFRGAAPMAAASLMRDCWDLMEPADRRWAQTAVENCLRRSSEGRPGSYSGAHTVDGAADCAKVLGAIVPKMAASDAEALLFVALMHFNDNVRIAAISGAKALLDTGNAELFNFCIHALVEMSKIRIAAKAGFDSLPPGRRPSPEQFFKRQRECIASLSTSSWRETLPALDEAMLSSDQELLFGLVNLFRALPGHVLAQATFDWVARQFGIWWSQRAGSRDRSIKFEFDTRNAFAEFYFASQGADAERLMAHLLPLVETQPKELSALLTQIIVLADQKKMAAPFWSLWSSIAEQAVSAGWLASLDRRSTGGELIRRLFLNIEWKPNVREWSCVGSSHRKLDDFFVSLPTSALVLEAYLTYLFHVGRQSLPSGLTLINAKFGVGLSQILKRSSESKIRLDQICSRLMFEDYAKLQAPAIKSYFMAILDALIAAGSCNAFLLREDFVTPTGGTGSRIER